VAEKERHIYVGTLTGSNKSLLGAVMTEDKIEQLAKKTWKPRGPKTQEGRQNSLRNLRPNVGDLDDEDIADIPDGEKLPMHKLGNYSILNTTERNYYTDKWVQYTNEFEMNTSADEALLDTVVMEEIVSARLYKTQLTTPKEDLSKQMSESAKRRNDAIKSLGISRTQRLGAKAGSEDNIATLVLQFEKNKIIDVEQKEEKEVEEEDTLMGKKHAEYLAELREAE
jgi:hypothetical protein